jgi:valyl-tRNA synthetase
MLFTFTMPDPSLPAGPPPLDQPYDPAKVEPRWYAFWEQQGVFAANEAAGDSRPVYVVPMPPPNVTGSLHMGHAQRVTLEDALVRWNRMRGYNVLWQPGTDHAGIATQLVVDRTLAREGTTRQALGREAFVARVWQWRRETGDRILVQQRLLGASPDWSRARFTMDANMSRAVTEAFVRLFEQGLMYRATRLINWCPECRTSLSDLEVENEEGANGELFEFAYEVEAGGGTPAATGRDQTPREIVVATTRPETMLGDTAVAVHPDDPRYKALHGQRVRHPFVDRTFPIVTDAVLVDPKFGTGAVKVTPAHDFNDFATGKRHKLDEINILNPDGTLNENAGPFAGMDRKEARRAVKRALEEKGLARGTKAHTLTLPRCQRSGGVVEPMISTQWFLAMEGLAERALEAVRTGKTEIVPSDWTKTYYHFLENIQDWCVSRQLWWGHQIPAWHGPGGQVIVARERPEGLGADWTQDPDVLDTWFSAALWPFSTQGWPTETPSLKKFYPASDLETGYDILFFWVARMIMMGLHFLGEVPFRRVLLSGLIVDETGEKMGKLKGNVIDPLDLVNGASFVEMVKKTLPGAPEGEALAKFKKAYPSAAAMGSGFPAFGADAVRFTLASYSPSNMRIALAPKRIEGNRHFLNKIWNATRLALDLLGDYRWRDDVAPKVFYNWWILSRFAAACEAANAGLGAFRVDEAALAAYHFFWSEFCAWYLELVKPILRKQADGSLTHPEQVPETRDTLAYVLEGSLRLMHPLMPFLTEELWQRVPRPASRKASIAFGPYPAQEDARHGRNLETEAWMDMLQQIISAGRTVRSEHDVDKKADVPMRVRSSSPDVIAFLQGQREAIRLLVKTAGDPVLEPPGGPREGGTTVSVVPNARGPIEVLVGLKGLVTREQERARIDRELKKNERELAGIEKKLSSPGFVDRAPPEVVEQTKQQRRALLEARERLLEARKLAEEL